MLGTAILAFPCAAVASGSQLVMNAFCTFTIMLLSLGVVGAIIGTRHKRAFWLGTAICGWIYLVLALQTWAGMVPFFLLSSVLTEIVFPFVEHRDQADAVAAGSGLNEIGS